MNITKNMDFAGRRILLASLLPDTGHLTPLIQIAENLRDEGASVHAIVPEEARPLVERFDISQEYLEPVIPEGGRAVLSRYSKAGELSRLLIRGPLFMSHYIIPLTANGVRQLDSLTEKAQAFKPELIIADNHLFSLEYEELANRCACPLVLNYSKGNHYCRQTEALWSGSRHTLVLKGRGWLQKLASPVHYKFDRLFRPERLARRLAMGRSVKEKRAGYHITRGNPPPVRNIASGLGITEAKYLGDRISLLGKETQLFGVLEPRSSWEGSSDVLDWIESSPDKPVVYMAFGTMVTPPYELIERIVRAVFSQKARVLIAARNQPELPQDLLDSGSFCWRTWVPQTAVLSHEAVVGFISHAGATSVQETLWYGKPILCIPGLWDQFYCSWVAEQLGFGVWSDGIGSRALPIETKVEMLLNNETLRENAQKLSAELREQQADRAIMEELMGLLGQTEEVCVSAEPGNQ